MPDLMRAVSAYSRSAGNFPPLTLINMFTEKSPTSDDEFALLSRKGLLTSVTRGTGPIRGVFTQGGVFAGDQFAVSATELYRGATLLGTVAGTDLVKWAARNGEVVVVGNSTAYSYNGTNLAAVTMPAGYSVVDVDFHDGLFIYTTSHANGSHRYYWSAVNDGRTVDALDFASAESKPDNLKAGRVINDTLYLFGEETIEPWANVGDADAPYQRIEQRIYSKGLKATEALLHIDNALVFVGNDNMVYRLGGDGPQRISDHWLEEKIAASASVSMFGFVDDGHSHVCIRLATATYAIDLATETTWELQSSGLSNWRARCATAPGTTPTFGDQTNGTIWTLSGFQDNAGTLERRFMAAMRLKGPQSIDTLRLWVNPGHAGATMDMRVSTDQGQTWTAWGAFGTQSMGASTAYRTRVEWRALGLYDEPGVMFEFKVESNAGLRVSGIEVNEASGGRSR